ncbi:MAG: Ni/Fe-hydrogenase cytochrome b subunit [bacterium]
MSHPMPHRQTRPFFTFGTLVLLIFMGIGFAYGLSRLLLGLSAVTNLTDRNPWGIWIAVDVACGVALAAGGFTTAALVDIFGRKRYHALLRPALLTAFLGYLWVAIALMFDLGRYWNIWRPIVNWQGNSVLFEVGMCVTFYLMVLSIELSPSIMEGLRDRMNKGEWGAAFLRRIDRPHRMAYDAVRTVLPLFICAGVVLSFMHQSSLGTLMLIAPTKLSTLWQTPVLPLLFLLSAIMVGFPMVILESIYASASLGRKPEMDLLSLLAGKVPWFIGLYGLVKIADLVVRRGQLNFLSHPSSTVALVIEVLVGIIVPFILLQMPAVRRSRNWLLFSVALVIFGVMLNRINVFLIGYQPAFLEKTYFPSVGEIALTITIFCSIAFCYRFFVIHFPILPIAGAGPEATSGPLRAAPEHAFGPFMTWLFRGIAVAFLLFFVLLYAFVHKQAISESLKAYRDVQIVKPKVSAPVKKAAAHVFRPAGYRNFYVLNSGLLNNRGDYFEPVRFSHRTHDVNTGGDCSVCHHRVAAGPDDRVGDDIKTMHLDGDVRIGGACSSCHDMTKKVPTACGQCHGLPNEPDSPARIGLKGAYHRQCIGCHAMQPAGANAPTDCNSCHHPLTPDHSRLVSLPTEATPRQITERCLACHETVGKDILKTAHWNWKGMTPDIAGHEHSINVGLNDIIDSYFISMGPNIAHFSAFHIGSGPLKADFDYQNPAGIDCLICHDSTGGHARHGATEGPEAVRTNLTGMAGVVVGRPGRIHCGGCHFYTGGGPNFKHGDLEPSLAKPTAELDVHMGMADMRCQDCHRVSKHQVAGLSFAAPVVEGRTACEDCHGSTPHGITGVLSRHLDDHVRTVSCEACHIPLFAREYPTLMATDFTQAGKDQAVVNDAYDMPGYEKKFGALTWGKNVVPAYRWFDGTRETRMVGDKIQTSGTVSLTAPLGERQNPQARIYPFKVHQAMLPYDAEKKTLVAPQLWDGYWKDYDWTNAVAAGMKEMGLPFSGKVGFVKTEMYTALHHTVPPAKQALGCTDCHAVEAVTCRRCHQKADGMNQPDHTQMVYPETKSRMNFKALGYQDDPALIGGRFYRKLGRGHPPQ